MGSGNRPFRYKIRAGFRGDSFEGLYDCSYYVAEKVIVSRAEFIFSFHCV